MLSKETLWRDYRYLSVESVKTVTKLSQNLILLSLAVYDQDSFYIVLWKLYVTYNCFIIYILQSSKLQVKPTLILLQNLYPENIISEDIKETTKKFLDIHSEDEKQRCHDIEQTFENIYCIRIPPKGYPNYDEQIEKLKDKANVPRAPRREL